MLLGEHDGRAWFAVIVDAEISKAAKGEWTPLRGLLPYLADDAMASAPLVFHALGLAEWLVRHPLLPALRRAARAGEVRPRADVRATGTRSSRAPTRR